ncbi:hypothetical protein LNTAR_04976 [Lentisphaera araneosa HTCC2155]|jgi:uncharacterized protein (DUF58 family)|uniref:DUF58 domain-containing protein n=1 Tax=Lentisphaera araneosa HTCC2155 TaxID=313628 RepID=A6DLI2_9BACT|nr:DUF58 domain-containing protein [Lentisphaera araneosa]EDM27437.1 hypothetical protein LNTAR_04976 [Lentisphaera araneosa HTCC2155]
MLLTDPQFIKRLEMLALLARKVLNGELKADRKSNKKGSGTTFADYQEYSQGDDLRNIDWNIAARLEQLVIKLFELEEDVQINILLDLSHSMASKQLYAKQLAAALSYIALSNTDRLTVYGIADSLQTVLKPSHGKSKIFPMLNSLEESILFGQDTKFLTSIKTLQAKLKRPAVCVVISDFLVEDGYKKALDLLRWSKNDVFCIQVLDPSELDCNLRGDLELECVETKAMKKVTVSPAEAAKFNQLMAEWNETLKNDCAKSGIGLIQTTTETPFETVIQSILRRGGLVA